MLDSYLLKASYAIVCKIESVQLDIDIQDVPHNLDLIAGQTKLGEGCQLVQA